MVLFVTLNYNSNLSVMLLKTWERWKNHTLTRFQAASHLTNAPLRQQPENSFEDFWLTTTTSQKPPTLLH